jgi:hypothetical protein
MALANARQCFIVMVFRFLFQTPLKNGATATAREISREE